MNNNGKLNKNRLGGSFNISSITSLPNRGIGVQRPVAPPVGGPALPMKPLAPMIKKVLLQPKARLPKPPLQ